MLKSPFFLVALIMEVDAVFPMPAEFVKTQKEKEIFF